MALINEIIPLQGFDVVEKRIGAILLSEISNQISLQSLDDEIGVYLERTIEYDKSEGVVFNVSANTGSYAGQNQSGSQGTISYTIDIYNHGTESSVKSGDADSLDRQNRYLGICRYIFNSTKYKTLDFPYGFVTGVYVESFQKDSSMNKDQSDYIRMVQLVLSVRVTEDQEMWESQPLSGNDTTIFLEDTDKGYKLIFNN